MKTGMKKAENKEIKIIDASGGILGRIASQAAVHLMGKSRPAFERNKYSGLPVKIINASKLRITPRKLESIYHTRYSGQPGGLRVLRGTETATKKGMKELVRLAIYRMLPKNKLKREMMKNLTIDN